MSSRGFTRDEVIPTLDVLYSTKSGGVTADSREMHELSALLNRLPIHPVQNRRSDFRTAHGISTQLERFERSLNSGINKDHVGPLFFQIASAYENNHDELHLIANAIRKNEPYYSLQFGNPIEGNCFPEGTLLEHLHRIVELRDGARVSLHDCCEVCALKPTLYYRPCGSILQQHLLIPPTLLDGQREYGSDSFVTVCPNCHEALHSYRPWLTRDNLLDILH